MENKIIRLSYKDKPLSDNGTVPRCVRFTTDIMPINSLFFEQAYKMTNTPLLDETLKGIKKS